MTKSLISVVIPVFNHVGTLEQSLKSIYLQSYQPLEVIIVNDGSTDNFKEVMKQLSSQSWYKQLNTKIIHQKNAGASAARNRGLKEGTGEYVIFWDADTVGRPEMLGRLKRQLNAHPEASYAYSQFNFGWKKFKCQEFKGEDLKKYNYIDTTSLIRRDVFKDLPCPFDELLKRFQDWDLWLTLLEKNKTGTFVPEVLYTKIVQGRKGISSWLPRLAYKIFSRSEKVKAYHGARQRVLEKHFLN